MHIVGIYAVWGFGPSRGSLLHPCSSLLPIPLHEPSFKVLWRGMGGQRRPDLTYSGKECGPAVSCPSPKNSNDNDGKGAMVPWTMRPIYSLVSYACILQCSKKQGAAKPRRRSRPKTKPEKAEPKGKGQEGFLGCGCQVGIPTFRAFFCPEILAFTGAFFNRFQSP